MPLKRKPHAITIRKAVLYRSKKTGRFTKVKRGAVKEEFIYQISKKGRILRTLEKFTATTSHITTRQDALDKPFDPNDRGLISQALAEKKILSSSKLKGAKKIEVTIKGLDSSSKIHRFKAVWDVRKEKDLSNLMVGRIQGLLSSKGFRPQYKLEMVDWNKRIGSKSRSRKKKILKNIQIIVTVKK